MRGVPSPGPLRWPRKSQVAAWRALQAVVRLDSCMRTRGLSGESGRHRGQSWGPDPGKFQVQGAHVGVTVMVPEPQVWRRLAQKQQKSPERASASCPGRAPEGPALWGPVLSRFTSCWRPHFTLTGLRRSGSRLRTMVTRIRLEKGFCNIVFTVWICIL